MMNIRSALRAVPTEGEAGGSDAEGHADVRLDQVFAALSDPIRRRILQQLDGQALLVSELAAPFNISLQGVSRHIQVLVRAGLIQQERSGRISRCTLEAGPLLEAAVWLNRYAKYWQGQFDLLAATLAEIDERGPAEETSQAHSPQDANPPVQSQPIPTPQSPRSQSQRALSPHAQSPSAQSSQTASPQTPSEQRTGSQAPRSSTRSSQHANQSALSSPAQSPSASQISQGTIAVPATISTEPGSRPSAQSPTNPRTRRPKRNRSKPRK